MKYDFDLEDKSKKRKKLILRILLILVEIILTVLLAYAITHYGLERMTVSGEYMSPTLLDGDEILIDRMRYRAFPIRRNDIVVVQHNGSEHNYYTIERVIGMPGEKIRIEEGEVYINGKKLKEKYDFPKMENGGLALEEITIEEDEYFMLCDNRNECEDSRNANIGNVHKQNIIGKAWLRTNSFALISHIDGSAKQKKSEKSDDKQSEKTN